MANIFNADRFGFVVIGDKPIVMKRNNREMSTRDWANRVLGIDQGDLPYCTRGYITRNDRIQFFTDDYTTDPGVDADMVERAYEAYMELFGVTRLEVLAIPVFNGVRVGKVGEQWPPCLAWDFNKKGWVAL